MSTNPNNTNQEASQQAEIKDGSAIASPSPAGSNYREWRTADKSTWARGEWDAEPDKVQWIDDATGLDCLIVRNGGGALCGYVGIPEGHPLYAVGYDEARGADGDWLNVHGGLTFAGFCSDHSREAWERFRARKPKLEAEAKGYPVGDASRILREWAGTFDDFDAWATRAQSVGVCHIPGKGRPDKVWWLGFDCAHSGDVCPSYQRFNTYEDSYKSMGYVKDEVRSLSAQVSVLRPAGRGEALAEPQQDPSNPHPQRED